MLLGRDGMPGCAVPPPGTSATAGDGPGVASSQGHANKLPFLVRPRCTLRVQGTAFGIGSGFGGRLFIYVPAGGVPKASQANGNRPRDASLWAQNEAGGVCGVPVYLNAFWECIKTCCRGCQQRRGGGRILQPRCLRRGTPAWLWQLPALLPSKVPAGSGFSPTKRGVSEIVCPCCCSSAYL